MLVSHDLFYHSVVPSVDCAIGRLLAPNVLVLTDSQALGCGNIVNYLTEYYVNRHRQQ